MINIVSRCGSWIENGRPRGRTGHRCHQALAGDSQKCNEEPRQSSATPQPLGTVSQELRVMFSAMSGSRVHGTGTANRRLSLKVLSGFPHVIGPMPTQRLTKSRVRQVQTSQSSRADFTRASRGPVMSLSEKNQNPTTENVSDLYLQKTRFAIADYLKPVFPSLTTNGCLN